MYPKVNVPYIYLILNFILLLMYKISGNFLQFHLTTSDFKVQPPTSFEISIGVFLSFYSTLDSSLGISL